MGGLGVRLTADRREIARGGEDVDRFGYADGPELVGHVGGDEVGVAGAEGVALVADDYQANWRNMGGVEARGKAKIIRGGPLFRQVREQLYKKFKVYRSNAPFEEGESAIIEVKPEKLFNWWFK